MSQSPLERSVGKVVSLRRRAHDGFGGCPDCGHVSGVRTVGRAHWLVCEAHRCKWFAGNMLFRASPPQSPSQWLATARELAGYREVTPSPWRWVLLHGAAEPDIASRIGT